LTQPAHDASAEFGVSERGTRDWSKPPSPSRSGPSSVAPGRAGRPDDERAQPAPSLDEAFAFELPVRLEHRVGVHRDGRHDLLGRGQPISRLEQSQPQCLLGLVHQLQVGGDTGTAVDPELDHPEPFHYLIGESRM
jgi:hypothetical protein